MKLPCLGVFILLLLIVLQSVCSVDVVVELFCVIPEGDRVMVLSSFTRVFLAMGECEQNA